MHFPFLSLPNMNLHFLKDTVTTEVQQKNLIFSVTKGILKKKEKKKKGSMCKHCNNGWSLIQLAQIIKSDDL